MNKILKLDDLEQVLLHIMKYLNAKDIKNFLQSSSSIYKLKETLIKIINNYAKNIGVKFSSNLLRFLIIGKKIEQSKALELSLSSSFKVIISREKIQWKKLRILFGICVSIVSLCFIFRDNFVQPNLAEVERHLEDKGFQNLYGKLVSILIFIMSLIFIKNSYKDIEPLKKDYNKAIKKHDKRDKIYGMNISRQQREIDRIEKHNKYKLKNNSNDETLKLDNNIHNLDFLDYYDKVHKVEGYCKNLKMSNNDKQILKHIKTFPNIRDSI